VDDEAILRPRAFSPDQLPHLELWLDARDLSGSDLSSVSLWPDRTVNARDMSQSTGSLQPKLLTSSTTSPTGANTVRWNGVNPGGTVMGTSVLTNLNFPTSARGMTVYCWAVFNFTTNDFNTASLLRTVTDGNWESGVQSSDASHQAYVRTNSGGGAVRRFTPAVAPFTGILTWVYAAPNDGTGHALIYVNFTPLGPVASDLWAITQTQTGNLILGAQDATGTRAILADIGSVLWYSSTHTQTEVNKVVKYLEKVFG